jgi:YVTN family beta-propeller protein
VSEVGTVIEVGTEPTALALDTGGHAYVANATDGTVSVIDLAANAVTDVIEAGTRPVRLAIDPGRGLLFVGDVGDQEAAPAGVLVVDLATLDVVETIEVGTLFGDLVLDPGSERAYFISPDSDESESLQAIDTATRELAGSVAVGGNLAGPLLDVEHGYAFLTSFFGSTLYVVDLANLQVNQEVDVPAEPGAGLSPMAFDPAGAAMYLRESEGPLHVLDSASLEVIASVPMGSGVLASVGAVAVDPVAGVAYVIKDRAGEVLVIDTSTYEILDTISLDLPDDGGGPGSAAVDPTTGTLYVVDRARDVVYVLERGTAS